MFFCLPTKVKPHRPRAETVPIANVTLIGLNVLAFWFSRWAGADLDSGIIGLVGYSFIHASWWHLVGNMWVLWVFGNPVNGRLGTFWYLLVYLGSAIFITLFLHGLLGIDLVGASGAIFAIIAVCLLLMPAASIEILAIATFPLTLLLGLFARPKHWTGWLARWGRFNFKALWGLFLVPTLEIWDLFWRGGNWTNLGHLLGLVCGVAAVLLLPPRISMNHDRHLGLMKPI